MAKLTRNSYKRKVILFGVILFVSIALISTGFAAWVMSTNARGEKPGNVTVGQVTDSKLTITGLSLDKTSFEFEPLETDTGGRVRPDGEHFESLKITVTGTVQPTEYLGELKVYLVVPESVKKAAEAGYIVLPDCATVNESTGGVEITLTDEEKKNGTYALSFAIEIKWGGNFGNVNPGIYYDEVEEGLAVSDANVKKALEDFRAVLYGYDTQLNAAEGQEARDAIIVAHANDSIQFKVIVTAKAN